MHNDALRIKKQLLFHYGVQTFFNCTTEFFVTFKPSGRLGNKICEYVHLLHISTTHNVPAADHPLMWDALHKMFPYMSVKPLPENCLKKVKHKPMNVSEAHSALERGLKGNLIVQGTPCGVTDFFYLRPLWLREMRFSRKLKDSSSKRLDGVVNEFQKRQALNNANQQVTLVGVHVRRGDYQWLLSRYHNGKLLPPAYYRAAFDYYREMFGVVLFVVLTEPKERKWCSENLAQNVTDVVVMDDGASEGQDLALLASFSHFVYSHGTFGLWGILLAQSPKTVAYPFERPLSHNQKRYGHYLTFDLISLYWTRVNFVKISFEGWSVIE